MAKLNFAEISAVLNPDDFNLELLGYCLKWALATQERPPSTGGISYIFIPIFLCQLFYSICFMQTYLCHLFYANSIYANIFYANSPNTLLGGPRVVYCDSSENIIPFNNNDNSTISHPCPLCTLGGREDKE
jgi:hypothetical protein